jgi:hypothetical protein
MVQAISHQLPFASESVNSWQAKVETMSLGLDLSAKEGFTLLLAA